MTLCGFVCKFVYCLCYGKIQVHLYKLWAHEFQLYLKNADLDPFAITLTLCPEACTAAVRRREILIQTAAKYKTQKADNEVFSVK